MRRFLVCISFFLAVLFGGAMIAEQSQWTDAVSSGSLHLDMNDLELKDLPCVVEKSSINPHVFGHYAKINVPPGYSGGHIEFLYLQPDGTWKMAYEN